MIDEKTSIDIVLCILMLIVISRYLQVQRGRYAVVCSSYKRRRRKTRKATLANGVTNAANGVTNAANGVTNAANGAMLLDNCGIYPIELHEEIVHADKMCGYRIVRRSKRMWSEC
jgi:hypothetical protein